MASIAIIIIASSRLAFALIAAGALLWVYCLTVLVVFFLHRILPRQGKGVILVFLSSLISALFFLVFQLISPLLALEIGCIIALVPCCFIGSRIVERINFFDIVDAILVAVIEAAMVSIVAIAVSLIREPLGFSSLSVPGGTTGVIELFTARDAESSFFPIRILASSAGALLLLGYGFALVRGGFQQQHNTTEEEL